MELAEPNHYIEELFSINKLMKTSEQEALFLLARFFSDGNKYVVHRRFSTDPQVFPERRYPLCIDQSRADLRPSSKNIHDGITLFKKKNNDSGEYEVLSIPEGELLRNLCYDLRILTASYLNGNDSPYLVSQIKSILNEFCFFYSDFMKE